MVGLRLPRALLDQVDEIAERYGYRRSTVLRRMIQKGIKHTRKVGIGDLPRVPNYLRIHGVHGVNGVGFVPDSEADKAIAGLHLGFETAFRAREKLMLARLSS